jgi:vacuolar-type H+-ATPase subunit H
MIFCYNSIMERDILGQVIEAEKEIQRCLDLEKVKVRDWLERVKKECEEEFNREAQNTKESLEKLTTDAAKEAKTGAAEITSEAAAAAERLGRLDAQTLTKIVAQQIRTILPG